MNKTDRSMLHRALCITLSALLVVTVAGIPESFAASLDAIGDAEVPMASFDDVAGDEGSFRGVELAKRVSTTATPLLTPKRQRWRRKRDRPTLTNLGIFPGRSSLCTRSLHPMPRSRPPLTL